MKYTAEEVRDYADACRLAHKGPVIADMLTELAERIKVDEGAAPVGFVMEATATRHKFGLLTQDLPPGAELFTHPPAQAAGVPDGWLTEARRLYDKVKAFPEKNGDPMTVGGTGFMQLLELRNHVENLLAAAPSAQSVDVKAIRKVIESHINEAKKLRHDPESQDYLYEQADKLEAALPEKGNG